MKARFPDAETLKVCEEYALWLRRGGGLRVRGRPLPAGDASGLDFEGFAEYVPGMDLRHLDWSIYARTRQLYVRQYADEGAGLLVVLLDASGSMALGSPSKWALARRLAAVFVFAALREVHQVLLGVIQGGRLHALPPTGGDSFTTAAFEFLGRFEAEGPTDLSAAVEDLPVTGARGDVVLISDFLDPHGPAQALESLSRRGFGVDLCRITAPDEWALPAGGAVYDPEGSGHRRIPQEAGARRRLEALVEAHRGELAQAGRRQGAILVELSSELSTAAAITQYFQTVQTGRGGRR